MAPEESEPLAAAPVYSQLGWQWNWHGITVGHLALVGAPGFLLYPLVWLLCPSLSLAYAAWPSLSLAVFVGIAQYGQPPDALWVQVQRALAGKRPNHLSPFLAETYEPAGQNARRWL
jgi:hypothetical protein